MSRWVRANREAFERDVLLDFCIASRQFEEQFKRLEETGTISYPVLRALVGEPMNKGILWRLKDKAHHLMRVDEEYTPIGLLLDWSLGYIFHESVKLMEDAHQQQYYVPKLAVFSGQELPPFMSRLLASLVDIRRQTVESMHREAGRLRNLFTQSRRLFCLFFEDQGCHRPLARLLYDRGDLVREVFNEDYGFFICSVYRDEPERMQIEAAKSLLESGRALAARSALSDAFAINPDNKRAVSVMKDVRRALESFGGEHSLHSPL